MTVVAPILSICIPTFNRVEYLRECLDSIRSSLVDGVEIVVSDNASTDATPELLEEYAKLMPLRWSRNSENLGFDLNIRAVVDMAQGAYCWTLGSDDRIADGSIFLAKNCLNEIAVDILHFGYTQCDMQMQPLFAVSMPSSVANHLDGQNWSNYFSSVPNISLNFAFMSLQIFRRKLWQNQLQHAVRWTGSQYVHLYLLHQMVVQGARVRAVQNLWVQARGGNPDGLSKLPGKLLRLDARAMSGVATQIYGTTSAKQTMGEIFRKSYPTKNILVIAADGELNDVLGIRHELAMLGVSRGLLTLLFFLRSMRLARPLRAMLACYRIMSKLLKSNQL